MRFPQIPALLLSIFVAHAALAVEPIVTTKSDQSAPRQMPGQGRFMAQLKKDLALSDDQVQKIEGIHQAAQQKNIENRKNNARGEFQLLMSLAPDSEEFDVAAKKMASTASANASERVAVMAETRKKVYAVLNAEQKTKFLEMSKAKPLQGNRIRAKGEKPAVE